MSIFCLFRSRESRVPEAELDVFRQALQRMRCKPLRSPWRSPCVELQDGQAQGLAESTAFRPASQGLEAWRDHAGSMARMDSKSDSVMAPSQSMP